MFHVFVIRRKASHSSEHDLNKEDLALNGASAVGVMSCGRNANKGKSRSLVVK